MEDQSELMRFYAEDCFVAAAQMWLGIFQADPTILLLDDERANILYCAGECLAHERFDWVKRLWDVTEDLYRYGYWNEHAQLESGVLIAAEKLGDRWLEATVHSELGWRGIEIGDSRRAQVHLEASLRLYSELDDLSGQIIAKRYLATLALAEGDLEAARFQFKALISEIQALIPNAPRKAEFLERQLVTLHDSLGEVSLGLGDYDSAESELLLGLAGADKFSPTARPISLLNLAKLRVTQQKLVEAKQLLKEALDLCLKGHFQYIAAHILFELAQVAKLQGDQAGAKNLARRAWDIYRSVGASSSEKQTGDFLAALD